MDIETIRGEERCELCGALKTAEGVDIKASWGAVEAMRRLADIWLQDRVACELLIARVALPSATYRELGRLFNLDPMSLVRRASSLGKYSRAIGLYVKPQGPHAQAQARRRARESRV